jgi:uncharacterized protein (TIGR02246 family)
MRILLLVTGMILGGCCLAAGMKGLADPPAQGQVAPRKQAPSEEEAAIRAASAAFVQAFNAGDVPAIAALFAEDAEAIDQDGTLLRGRAAVADSFAESFAANPGSKMAIRVDSLRFITADVAKEDGRCTITPGNGGPPDVDRYSVIFVKKDGKWLQNSVRELAASELTPHHHLEELAWMIGDWVDERADGVTFITCAWSDDKNFLLRNYTIQVDGKTTMNGTQRIGWDPVNGQFRSWVFDSLGGYSEGLWSADGGARWVVKMSGPLRDGTISSETNIITRVNKDLARWKSVDRTVGGVLIGDSRELALARKPPAPKQ